VLSTLPFFPRMLSDLSTANANMIRSVDAARASLALLDLALGDLDKFIRSLQGTRISRGDIVEADYKSFEADMKRAVDSLNRAAVAASQGAQLYDMARAEQIEAGINTLGLAQTPERYATLQHALDTRFHNASIDYASMLRQNLSPGEVVAASVIAADTKSTPQAVVDEAASTHQPIIDVANARGMQAFSLKIFMNLVLYSYTDDPDKEARVLT
jgi:hypothetical protein